MNAVAMTEIQIRGSPPSTKSLEPLPSRPAPPPAEEQAKSQKESPAPPEEVEQAAEGVNAFLRSSGSHIQFAMHQESKRMMVEVVDDKTQQVVKTIPPKALLDLAAKIDEMVGLLLDKKG